MTKNYKNGILEIVFNKKQESKPNDGAKSRIKENQDIRRQNHNMQKSRISSTSSVSTPSDYVRYAPSTVLKAGTPAPDFTLHSTPDQKVSLSQFHDRAVILAFYPSDWSRVCGDEMTLFNEILPEFEKFDTEIMGLPVDGVWCHLAFSKDRKLRFSLLSDFEPKGEVARKYGVYRREDVLCLSLIRMGSFAGAMCLQLVLIPAHMVFLSSRVFEFTKGESRSK